MTPCPSSCYMLMYLQVLSLCHPNINSCHPPPPPPPPPPPTCMRKHTYSPVGFLYAGTYFHQQIQLTQNIAPLQADFNPSFNDTATILIHNTCEYAIHSDYLSFVERLSSSQRLKIHRPLAKEHRWAVSFTCSPNMEVGTLSNVSTFNPERAIKRSLRSRLEVPGLYVFVFTGIHTCTVQGTSV